MVGQEVVVGSNIEAGKMAECMLLLVLRAEVVMFQGKVALLNRREAIRK